MAQGCNLQIDWKDLQDIRSTAGRVAEPQTRKAARASARAMFLTALSRPKCLQEILTRGPSNKNYEVAREAIEVALAAENAPVHERAKLLPALNTILKSHSKLPGMFKGLPAHRGPGAGPLVQHYELTATARLCQLGQANLTLKTSTGVDLAVRRSDGLSFGYKFAGHHVLSTKGKNTIESDISVERGGHLHAIDTKYTSKPVRELHLENEFSRKLHQASNALNDGQLASFSFVTNAQFCAKTKEAIFRENCRLLKSYAESDNDVERLLPASASASAFSLATMNVESDDQINQHRATLEKIIAANSAELPLIGIAERIYFKP